MRTEHRLTTFTQANGEVITTRSALEARWLIFFSKIGLNPQYEPMDFGHYLPDFLVKGLGWIEVKPTLDLLTTESARKIEKTAKDFPAGKFYAFIGNQVGFELTAMWQGDQLYAVPGRMMMQIICNIVRTTTALTLSNVPTFIHGVINYANNVKLDHFVSVGKVIDLNRIAHEESARFKEQFK